MTAGTGATEFGPTSDDPLALAELAGRLARAAGTLARDGRMAHGGEAALITTATTKASATDLVTEHDRAAEELLVDRIARARPDDGIIGEEGATADGTSGLRWFLDPIDGTTNFVYGHPMWSTSVAVGTSPTDMVAGAVYVADHDELFVAASGRGATLNGEPIVATATDRLDLALIATGMSYTVDTRRRQARVLAELLGHTRDVRRSGSAAIDLCYAAAGRIDAYYERPLNIWDIAAGQLIATEAGCVSAAYDGGPTPGTGAFVAAPGIFGALWTLVGELESAAAT